MEIEFYRKSTGEAMPKDYSDDWLFVMNDKVYTDNDASFESQQATVSFDDFIKECPDMGWRVKGQGGL